MNFTFGIVTSGNADNFISTIIDSIVKNNIPNYEIIIVGNTNIEETSNIKKIYFDENIRKDWITRKKNIIVNNAKYENIVLLHDYVTFVDGWYNGFLQFGNDFEFCITKIINNDGKRFRDYTLYPNFLDYDNYFKDNCLLPYDFKNNIKTNKYMYISGSYYIIKKHIACKYLLDESLIWGQGEDLEYSERLQSNGVIIKCNHYSEVYLLKQKKSCNWEKEINEEYLNKFINYCNEN